MEQSLKKRILVLFGGKADEHSISCLSAGSLLRAIDRDKFDPIPVAITVDGEWIIPEEDPRHWSLSNGDMPIIKMNSHSRRVIIDPSRKNEAFFVVSGDVCQDLPSENISSFIKENGECEGLCSLGHIDAIFPVLHGIYGEDGSIQGLLEIVAVPYVGCGVFASAACMDKHFTKTLLRAAGIPVAPSITIDARVLDQDSHFEKDASQLQQMVEEAHLKYPLFVKPAWGGSSFGVSKVDKPQELAHAIYVAFPHSWRVLVEQSIDAREIECSVLSVDPLKPPQVALPGEVVVDTRKTNDEAFYDFDAKYTDSSASHVEVPADISQETIKKVQDLARRSFSAVDGSGLMRVDTFVCPDNSVMVNEINTMPGFTSISMYPQAWAASGISYTEIISLLIDSSIEHTRRSIA